MFFNRFILPYPELLSKEEWTTCFENALKALWLPWGGLSTIDKADARFCAEYTGENPASYHNGDSLIKNLFLNQ